MTEQEYRQRENDIKCEYSKAQKMLNAEYAAAQRKFKIGDIIKSDNGTIIRVDKFSVLSSFLSRLPEPVYIGLALKKDLTPRAKGGTEKIFGNDGVELVKAGNN